MKLKCWVCGNDATEKHYERVKKASGFTEIEVSPHQERWRCYCESCKAKVDAEDKALKAEYTRLKKEVMFNNALETLEGQKINIYEYREAIDVIHDFLKENPDSFDSSYEVLAAIILIHNRVQCKTQYQIGRYRVDFLLPDEYVVLEIDGDRHKHKKYYDSERDKTIKKELGEFWEIIRIDTDLLKTNAAELVNAIRKICEYRIFGNHIGIYRS